MICYEISFACQLGEGKLIVRGNTKEDAFDRATRMAWKLLDAGFANIELRLV